MFKIFAHGHKNIRATHRTTFEITKSEHLTPRGDCIIGVGADKGLPDIPESFKQLLKKGHFFEVELLLPDYGLSEKVVGRGDASLTLSHPEDIVVRKSNYTCPRTLLVKANKAAADLSREMVEYLKEKNTELVFTLRPLKAAEMRD
ncbi:MULTISPECIES: DUF371 domain-containing protein [Archaeoglobus]|uniref:DUF371 domain-containing protein n=3 Tax=Archaeoglobus fulgidus TaxID=2234 RepID=O29194_ARCFU|nr:MULTISPECIES: DUF371 domain-containing protein [Archaeoglobus]AAB90172.1 conserved hypothetical protein [Archaeoglobus fulgidus DSM 4304]AIG97947.1 hypothetical protein AFULGI_00011670 [Archaeoglobus fulgidus DSM 8774]KUJ94050.1 MAG: hypothetical protein XD40_0762 [Archaeoglobus fulgidus]KUK06615.1 MAG: hypothetical protein XD48_1172 [Archaeoglobus fulgidus]MDI3498371.1 uncharacterized protein [Archaeoglobus sp.]